MRTYINLLVAFLLVGSCIHPNPKRSNNKFIKDLVFNHKKHEQHDLSPKECDSCHRRETTKFSLPSMNLCANCHTNLDVVPAERLIDDCSNCHKKIKKSEPPASPWHYGNANDHQLYSKQQPIVYCAYCHNKNPEVFPIKERYEQPRELCVGCHDSEGKALPGGPK